MPDLIPEPPDSALVLVGGEDNETVYLRDDRGLQPDDSHRWFPLLGDDEGEARTWDWLAEREPVRLYRQAEVDRLVSQARRFGLNQAVRPIGEHLVESQGYCRTCGSHHSPEEIARLEDRLAEEREGAGRG
jgi:hypothetical protein